jgi:hypothetical protein
LVAPFAGYLRPGLGEGLGDGTGAGVGEDAEVGIGLGDGFGWGADGDDIGLGDATGAGDATGLGAGDGTGLGAGDGTGLGAGRRRADTVTARCLMPWWWPIPAARATPVPETTSAATGSPIHRARLRNASMLTSSVGRLGDAGRSRRYQ